MPVTSWQKGRKPVGAVTTLGVGTGRTLCGQKVIVLIRHQGPLNLLLPHSAAVSSAQRWLSTDPRCRKAFQSPWQIRNMERKPPLLLGTRHAGVRSRRSHSPWRRRQGLFFQQGTRLQSIPAPNLKAHQLTTQRASTGNTKNGVKNQQGCAAPMGGGNPPHSLLQSTCLLLNA